MGWAKGMGRLLYAFAIGLFATYVTYVFASTVLLNSYVLERALNPKPEHARIRWGFAYSYWPRRLDVHDFSIVGQGLEIQWELSVKHARGHVSILPLLRRRFDAEEVVAEGATLRLRPTVAPVEEELLQARAFPPIRDVVDPPIRFEGPLRPPEEGAWTVDLRGARFVDVREVWIGPYRMETQGEVSGDLHTRAGWNIFFDAAGELERSKVFIYDRVVIDEAHLRLNAAMDLADIPHTIGPERLRTLRGTLRGEARGVSLGLIGQHAPDAEGQVEGTGTLKLAAGYSGGVLTPGSSLQLLGEGARFSLDDGFSVSAPRWTIDGRVTEKGAAIVSIEAAPLKLRTGGDTLLESPRGRIIVDAPNAIVIPPLPNHRMRLELDATKPAPIERFSKFFAAAPVDFDSGWVIVEGGGSTHRRGDPSGALHVRIHDAKGRFKDGAFAGGIELELNLERLRTRSGVADLSGSLVRLHDLSLSTPHGRIDGWDATLTMVDASLRTRSRRLIAALQGNASDARPLLLLKDKKSKVDRFLEAKGLELQAQVDMSPQRLIVPRFQLDGRGLNLHGAILRDDGGTRGALLAKVRGLPVGVTFMGKDTATSFALREVWLQERLEATGVTEAIRAAQGKPSPGVGGSADAGR